MKFRAVSFVARRSATPRDRIELELRPLVGGLESSVTAATVSAGAGVSVPQQFVVKRLRGRHRRETAIYELLWAHIEQPPAARMLHVESAGDAEYLYLEHLQALSSWPWSDMAMAVAVCRTLARFHDTATPPSPVFDWDYDAELLESADETVAVAMSARDHTGLRHWRRPGELRRVVAALPRMRAGLESRRAIIHGDMHPGNVIVQAVAGHPRVALIDWGRARIGSPLEDVASWLHALGCWEPEVRRRHDTLLRVYLDARQVPQRVTADLRRDYWFASASNGLAGAIRYHLLVLCDRRATDTMRVHSRRALGEWQRVVRRAAALVACLR